MVDSSKAQTAPLSKERTLQHKIPVLWKEDSISWDNLAI